MLNLKKKYSFYILRFLDRAGVFYFILSAVFAFSGEIDERCLHLFLLSSIFGLFILLIERYKAKNK